MRRRNHRASARNLRRVERDDADCFSGETRELYETAVQAREAGDYRRLDPLARDLVRRCEESSDVVGTSRAYALLGHACFLRNDAVGAQDYYSRALMLFKRGGDSVRYAQALMSLGVVALDLEQNLAKARIYYDEALPIMRKVGDTRRLAVLLGNFGEVLRSEGECREALSCAREALALFRSLEDHAFAGWQLVNIAHYQLLDRNRAAAIVSMREALEALRRDEDVRWIVWYFDVWIIIAAEISRWDDAARLLGFVDHLRDVKNLPRSQAMLNWFSVSIERIARHLSDEQEDALILEGESMTMEQAAALTARFEA